MKFSERIGISPAKKTIQIESIDDELRNTLWSIITTHYWEKYFNTIADRIYDSYPIYKSNLETLFKHLWLYYFKKPIDNIPKDFYGNKGGLLVLREYFFDAKWYNVYDFIEFISTYCPNNKSQNFIKDCNYFLEEENSGYRFIDGKIIEISSTDEIEEIEKAIAQSTPFYGVKQHFSSAISLMSDRKNPDHRNSIKESISAVEALCKKVSNDDKATLGAALKILEKKGELHPALKTAFSSLYGYTNDADGIRHALLEESTLTSADARFMLISCSAFVNYVIASIE